MTDPDAPWMRCNQLMWTFDYPKRLAAWIWAARLNHCPICEQQPHDPCVNMTDVRRFEKDKIPLEAIRFTKWPHSQRIDWEKLEKTLLDRGYKPESVQHKKERQERYARERRGHA